MLLPKFVGFLIAVVTIALIFLGGWLLKLAGKDHGRWESFTMFLPAMFLLLWAMHLRRNGRKALGAYIMSGLFFAFGLVVLVIG